MFISDKMSKYLAFCESRDFETEMLSNLREVSHILQDNVDFGVDLSPFFHLVVSLGITMLLKRSGQVSPTFLLILLSEPEKTITHQVQITSSEKNQSDNIVWGFLMSASVPRFQRQNLSFGCLQLSEGAQARQHPVCRSCTLLDMRLERNPFLAEAASISSPVNETFETKSTVGFTHHFPSDFPPATKAPLKHLHSLSLHHLLVFPLHSAGRVRGSVKWVLAREGKEEKKERKEATLQLFNHVEEQHDALFPFKNALIIQNERTSRRRKQVEQLQHDKKEKSRHSMAPLMDTISLKYENPIVAVLSAATAAVAPLPRSPLACSNTAAAKRPHLQFTVQDLPAVVLQHICTFVDHATLHVVEKTSMELYEVVQQSGTCRNDVRTLRQ